MSVKKTAMNDCANYATNDLYLASFLKAQGLKLVGTEREGRRVSFVFEDCPDRKSAVSAFYNDGVVRVNDFTHALQDLKGVIYNW